VLTKILQNITKYCKKNSQNMAKLLQKKTAIFPAFFAFFSVLFWHEFSVIDKRIILCYLLTILYKLTV
jgi:hypothetical protein